MLVSRHHIVQPDWPGIFFGLFPFDFLLLARQLRDRLLLTVARVRRADYERVVILAEVQPAGACLRRVLLRGSEVTGKQQLTKTMRIDLIPKVPSEPVAAKKKRVVIATAARKYSRPQADTVKSAGDSRYEELFQSVYDAALITDLSGRIVDVNVRAVDFLLYERNELCDLTVFDVISGADKSLIRMLNENLEKERFTLIQAYCIRRNGSFFPSEIAVNKLRLRGMHLCFFVRDITLRKQAEEMLMTEHNAIQNSRNGIAIADLNAKIEYVNPSVKRMWGYKRSDELLGRDVRNLFSDRVAVDEMFSLLARDGETWTGEIRAKKKDNGECDVQISGACNRNSDGEPVGVVLSFVDISDRKRAVEAEKEAERQRVMLESLGAACHHLGQPATVLLTNLSIMQRRLDPADEKVGELIGTSIRAAKTLGEILHKLNKVDEYKTAQYLAKSDGEGCSDTRILEI